MGQYLNKLLTKNFKAMKKLHKLITVVALAIFMLGSFTANAQKNNPLDYVGKSHNKNLDKIYSELLKAKNVNSKEEAKKVITEISKKMISEKDIEKLDFLNNDFNFYPPQTYDYYFKLIESKKDIKIPSDYKKYSLKMESLIKAQDKQGLIKLVDEVKSNVNNKNIQEAILAAIAVAYNSMEYWSVNTNKWQGFKFTSNVAKSDWWKVGAVDAVAAAITIGAGFFSGGIAWGSVGVVTARSSAIAAVMIQ
jgi:hypothetical protein